MNELGEFIKQSRLALGLSLRDFGKLCDISHTHIDSIEKGIDYRTGKTVNVTNDTLVKIANALHLDPSFIFNLSVGLLPDIKESGSGRKGVRIPVLGNISAGIPLEAISNVIGYEEIDQTLATQGEYFGLKIKGNSMYPRILDGDVVIIKKQDDVFSGEIAVVMVNGEDATIKKILKDENGIQLISFNQEHFAPKFYSNQQIEELPVVIIGKLVELRGKY